MTFGARLKALRQSYNLTQTELANKIKLSKANVSKYESDSIEPNLETLKLIAELFNVSVDHLLGQEDKKEKPAENDELENKNVKFIGRDGTVKFKKLSPEMIAMLEQLPDSGDDI